MKKDLNQKQESGKVTTSGRPILKLNFGGKLPEALLERMKGLKKDVTPDEKEVIKNQLKKKNDIEKNKDTKSDLKNPLLLNNKKLDLQVKPNKLVKNQDITTDKPEQVKPKKDKETKAKTEEVDKADTQKLKKKKKRKPKAVEKKNWLLEPNVFKEMLSDFEVSFPNSFSRDKKLLGLAIRNQLKKAKPEYSHKRIGVFLSIYCTSRDYRKKLSLGAERVDLDGVVSSYVTEEQIEKGRLKEELKLKTKKPKDEKSKVQQV